MRRSSTSARSRSDSKTFEFRDSARQPARIQPGERTATFGRNQRANADGFEGTASERRFELRIEDGKGHDRFVVPGHSGFLVD
jgi:hypothetical protein